MCTSADESWLGILAEGAVGHVVLGIGINVQSAAYPADVAARATSIEAELGRPVDRGLVLAECLAASGLALSRIAGRPWTTGGRCMAQSRGLRCWAARVEWESAGRQQVGLAENIDDDGALIVKVGAGTQKIRSGEVRWL